MSTETIRKPKMRTVTRKMPYWEKVGPGQPRVRRVGTIQATGTPGDTYVELSFDYSGPVEVFSGGDEFTAEPGRLGRMLDAWILDNDITEREDEPDLPLRRVWLATYIENS